MRITTYLTLACVAMFVSAGSADAQTLGDFATFGDTYDIEIAQQIDGGLFRGNNGNGFDVPAEFDGNGEAIGATTIGAIVIATENFTDFGDGTFELQFSVTSAGNLAPSVISGSDVTAVRFAIGSGFIGGDELEVLPHVATFAELAVFDQNGSLIVSEDALGLGAFNDDANSFSAFEGFINTNIEGGALGAVTASGDADRVAEARLTIRGFAVPEPSSAALLLGLGLFGHVVRRRCV